MQKEHCQQAKLQGWLHPVRKWTKRLMVKARSHCTDRCKEDNLKKKNLAICWRKAIHLLYTNCVRISYALPIKHPKTMISSARKVLNCIKPLERMNFPQFTMSIYNIYEQQMDRVCYHSLNVCGVIFASSWPPPNLHPLPVKTKDKVHRMSIYC